MKSLYFLFSFLLFLGCKPDPKLPTFTDTPTSGKLNILVDEAFQPMMKQQIDAFHIRYVKAKITAQYKPEREILKRLFNRSIDLAVIGRKFTDKEIAAYKSASYNPVVYPVFYDAVAIVAHNSSALNEVTTEQLKTWLNAPNGNQQIYLDNTGSGIVRFLQDEKYIGKSIVADVAGSPEDVLKAVANNPSAIGLVPMNWISDPYGLPKKSYGNSIKIIGLKTNKGIAYPDQKSLSAGAYPLRRVCYVIDISARNGLARGFLAFYASQIGQLVVLKSGLLPADIPETIINIIE